MRLSGEILAYLDAVVSSLPGRSGSWARSAYVRRRLNSCGPQLGIARGCAFVGTSNMRFGRSVTCGERCFFAAVGGEIDIGDRVAFNTNVHVNASLGKHIRIGNDVLIGPNVVLRSADHRFERIDVPIRNQGHVAGEIVIEDDVWIGANVVIVSGVRVGRGAVLAAGAIVTSDVAPRTVVGGVPARLIKSRGGKPE